MRIRSVSAVPVRLPLTRTVALSTGTQESSSHIVVVVETEDGVRGYGELAPRPTLYGEDMRTAATMVREVLAPRVVGVSVGAAEVLGRRLASLANNPSAKAAIEIAAFDAWGRTLGTSCADLLGGYAREVALCALLGYGEPAAVLDEAVQASGTWGVDAFKLKIGPDVETDVAVAHALREGLGEDATIYADANQRYSPADALTFLTRTRECGLLYVEEPTASVHHRELLDREPFALLADETVPSLAAAHAALSTDVRYAGVSIKPARSGLRESGRIRDLAATSGVRPIIGSQGDAAIGAVVGATFAAASALTAGAPAELLFFTGMADHVIQELPLMTNGRMRLGDGPGFGFNVDEDKLDKYRIADHAKS